ncbi:MAG: hypothetical protein ACRD6R_14480 [Candidatus Polarisedimenticolia bacterium]
MKQLRVPVLLLIVVVIAGVVAVAAAPVQTPAASPVPAGGCIGAPDEGDALFTPAVSEANEPVSASTGLLQLCKVKYPCQSQNQICNDSGCTCQHDGATLRCAR